MNSMHDAGFADRLKAAAEAKKALLAGFRPKPTVTDPKFAERDAQRAAELDQVRRARTQARLDKKQAAADAEEAIRAAAAAVEAAALEAKRGQRKERQALSKAEAKAKRDARYAARKARK
jgi:hypothetical protein